ncbi:protein SABRE-like isoform X1 [Canna indica]|uniref:Protein SABRE-like isoform X1 n=1 Tax=Canna indica TaxID=4628 RepID=A0AAQ3JPQ2_9LILI|nr:protein SABRE-like isoform X1 [Canna indica]
MALFLVKFLFGLLVFLAAGWVLFVFAVRLVTWILSKTIGVSIAYQVAGCNCLKDVFVTFKKGATESILIGEIKLGLRESLVKHGLNFFSGDQRLQLSISDLEVYLRSPAPNTKKNKSRSSRRSPRSLGQGTWIFLSKIAKLLSVVVTEFNVKGPKFATQVRGLRVVASVHGESNTTFNISLQLAYFLFDMFHPELGFDQSSSFTVEKPAYSSSVEKKPSPFMCEEISVISEIAYTREHGVKFGSLDVSFRAITINMTDNLFVKNKTDTKSSACVDGSKEGALDDQLVKKPEKSKSSPSSLKKHIFAFPEKVSFNIQELDATFRHQGADILANNTMTGILLTSNKTVAYDDSGEATSHFSLSLDFSKISLLRGGITSIMEVLEFAVIATVDVPMQPLPIQAEIDVKLGSTSCNIIFSRLRPLLNLKSGKQKPMVLREEGSHKNKKPTDNKSTIMWRCTLSAPEMVIMVYEINDCPLYQGCLLSSHLIANNVASKKLELHAELGEFHLKTIDMHQQPSEKKLTGAEIKSGSLVLIERLRLDCGHTETELHDEQDLKRLKLVLAVDMTGMGISFGFKHVESLIKIIMTYKELLKGLTSSSKKTAKDKVGQSSKKETGKGINILKLNLERCSVKYFGDTSLEDMTVADPKRVRFGSQGGEVIISVSADGKPREASITALRPNGCQHLKSSTSLDILHLRFVFNKEKHSMQIEVDRTRSVYSEYTEEQNSGTEVTLLDVQKAKFVRRSGGLNDVALCSLLNVTDISIKWEPDAHLALHQFVTSLKFLLSNQKQHGSDQQRKEEPMDTMPLQQREITSDQAPSEKQHKKRDSVFAIDVEMLKVSAELADGVETMIHVQSIFSENAKIGILFEEVIIACNEARLLRSSRLQVSRVPVSAMHNLQDSKSQMVTTWDWVIRSPDIYICLPYRLQLRAIDDAVEDTLRGLKLISTAKTDIISSGKRSSTRKSKSSSTNFGSVRLIIRRLTVEIEEEPIQGWLDEHYQLMKKEACEAVVRLKFLDEHLPSIISSSHEQDAVSSDNKINYKGSEIDACDASSVELLQTEIHKKVFRSYYEACQKIVISEGSGASREGFQSGFKPSINRASLMSLCATELDVTLTKIDKGSDGMIEFIKKVDPVCSEKDIPFSRLYGSDFILNAESLVVKIRDYTYPLFCGSSAKCQGRVVIAQQATSFQPQILQDTFVGRWWKVCMLRSASGTTPPNKVYLDLPISFHKGEVSFGVGYEPVFADISYAFTVALRRANLGTRSCPDQLGYASQFLASSSEPEPPAKEKSLPWWDEMRNYIHGKVDLSFTETKWFILGTTNPYENLDKLEVVSANMEIQQRDGHICLSAKEFKVYLSSLQNLMDSFSLKPPSHLSSPFLATSAFLVEVLMEWGCESGNPLDHYLFSLPIEGKPRMKVYDPFRSTSLSLRWNFSLNNSQLTDTQLASSSDVAQNTTTDGLMCESSQKMGVKSMDSPTANFSAHDLAWLFKFWNLNYLPPHKLRTFSRWPRFGVPRIARSGNLSLDRVMTEFFLRLDITPVCIRHTPLRVDDPANGLTVKTAKLKYELCFSRGKQEFTFDCKREPLDQVYQGVDVHMLKVYIDQTNEAPATKDIKATKKSSRSVSDENKEKRQDDGFLLFSDYFTVRRQTSKADTERLLAWQEYGRKDLEMTYVISDVEIRNESGHTQSDLVDDDGFSVVIADNCQRVFVYGLKILWTLENRIAISSLVGGISKAFEPPKPSPSKLYSQRKSLERQQIAAETDAPQEDVTLTTMPNTSCESSAQTEDVKSEEQDSTLPVAPSSETEKPYNCDADEEGTCLFMVNVVQPQFNLHSEEAKGRFLLAAASGRVLARSFRSILHVGHDVIEQALNTSDVVIPDNVPEMTWKRMELSMMLEHVQAHVAPTDIDPGAGIQWLPKILRDAPNVKRTGPLLERVFTPCQMYFQYTQYKGGTPELKVKPLKELTFNSPDITSEMTSRQFRVMLDVLTNLLFARLPKPPKSSHSLSDDNEDVEDEANQLVPEGVEEVDLAKINIEQKRREHKLLLSDIKTLEVTTDVSDGNDLSLENFDLWMVTGGRSTLIQGLKKEQGNILKAINEAYSELRLVLQEAAQIKLTDKEKNKSPSCAIKVSVRINKVVWSMLIDDKPFAEAEINDMIYDFDRDYKDIGIAQFTTKSFVVRNCVPSAKSDMLLSAWSAPPEWGKRVMLSVNAKQGAPKDGKSAIEYFQVEIYPLRIHLTETMYNMMWEYIFPEDEQDSLKRQEVWKVSTTAGSKRGSKTPGKSSTRSGNDIFSDAFQMRRMQNIQENTASGSNPPLRRTSSFGKTWEETVADSVANELVLQVTEESRNKPKDSKPLKCGQSNEEKKVGKPNDERRTPSKKLQEFHNIRISQVELLVTYEGSRIAVSDFRLLMDTFHRDEFIGTWRRLFARVKKHIVWGVLKSVAGMQGKKFKDKTQNPKETQPTVLPENDLNNSDSDGDQRGKPDQFPTPFPKRSSDGAGDGFVTSIRGLFNSQRRKAKAYVLRTMRGEGDNDHGDWSDGDVEFSPFARQLTIAKTKKLIRRHSKKFNSRTPGSSDQNDQDPFSPKEIMPFESDSSGASSYGDDIRDDTRDDNRDDDE